MIGDMGATGGRPGPAAGKPRALAFYLPQFHPIPENDEWWGRGFTEWLNVTKAKPLYPGHRQPHVPTELGYYDLRVPEVREAQAALAAEHGIHGFVYYHYWFHGRRLLERPFDEVLASGSPDFPFALCWANEEWTRNWDAQTGEVLMAQEFGDEDDLAHIRWLCTAFADERYIKIDGRPLMLIYRAEQLPNAARTAEIWRTEAQRHGFPDLYLCWVESHGPPQGGPEAFGLDATVGFMPLEARRTFAPTEAFRGHRMVDYVASFEAELRRPPPPWKRFPSVMAGWDNTPRRRFGATIYEDASPEAYENWLRRAVASTAGVREEENYLFILAWNEWAEGNHLEPDEHFGRAFLEATRAVLLDPPGTSNQRRGELAAADGEAGDREHFEYVYPFRHETALAHAAELVRDLRLGEKSAVVDLGAGTAVISHVLRDAGVNYHGVEVHPKAVELMQKAGIPATQCDLTDTGGLLSALDDIGDVGAFMLLDVIEHLVEPQQLLSALSTWALKHGEPTLVGVGAQRHPLRHGPQPALRKVGPERAGSARQHPSALLLRGDPRATLRALRLDGRLAQRLQHPSLGPVRHRAERRASSRDDRRPARARRGDQPERRGQTVRVGAQAGARPHHSGHLPRCSRRRRLRDARRRPRRTGSRGAREPGGAPIPGVGRSGRERDQPASGPTPPLRARPALEAGDHDEDRTLPTAESHLQDGPAPAPVTNAVTGERPDPWVLVMGMHRSGTSALTGALGATGLQLYRPDDRVEWAESNPEHWESLSLTLYDEDLLVRFDGSWDAPPTLPSGWERGSEVPAVADATRAIESAYPESGPSLWKDPRLCLLLPFWRNVLAPPLAAVFVWRSPIAVARSLLHRDQLPLSDGLALWERYNRAGLEALDGVETYVVSYESIVERPEERLGELLDWLGSLDQFAGTPLEWDPVPAAASIAEELRHHAGREDTDPDPTCLPEQLALAEYLAASAGGHRPFTAQAARTGVAVDDLAAATSPKN